VWSRGRRGQEQQKKGGSTWKTTQGVIGRGESFVAQPSQTHNGSIGLATIAM
jgi:hypothetical protein